MPAVPETAVGERRSIVIVAVIILGLCLTMLLSSGWALKHWRVGYLGAEPSLALSPFANAAVLAFLVARVAFSLLGLGAAIYLLRLHVSWEPALFMAAGWSCAAVIAMAWWYGLREYAGLRGVCPDLFDLSRSPGSRVDYVSDCSHYFIYASVFSAFWVGIIAGGLRLQSARASEGGSASNELRQFQAFYWACFLGWAVQYRLSQWFAFATSHHQEWVLWAFLDFVFLTASSLWALPFIHSLWKKKPRTWLQAVLQAYWRSFVIVLLTTVTFSWLIIGAAGTLKPLATWNVFGLAWALTVGTWRWRALQKQLVAVAPQA